MNLWYLLTVPAWIVLVITATARLADIGPKQWKLRDHFRRLGLIGIGVIAAVGLATPFTMDSWIYDEPDIRYFGVSWAWAVVWMTTEGMPPWWDYILGVHRHTEEWAGLGWRARMRGEWKAMLASFKPRRYRSAMTGPEGPLL